MGLVAGEKSWFGSSNGELEECPGLCVTWMTDAYLWRGTQHPCSQRKAMVSVEGGSAESLLGRGRGWMLVGQGARNPESTEEMAGREGGKEKLG